MILIIIKKSPRAAERESTRAAQAPAHKHKHKHAHVRTSYHNHNVEEIVAGGDVRQRQAVREANIRNDQKVYVALVRGHDHDRNVRRSFVHLHHQANEKKYFLSCMIRYKIYV